MKTETKRGMVPAIILVGIGILLVGAVGYKIYEFTGDKQTSDENAQYNIENWKTYKNNEYGFEFLYPRDAQFSDELFGEIREINVVFQPDTDRLTVSIAFNELCNFSYSDLELSRGSSSEKQIQQSGLNWRNLQYESDKNAIGGYWEKRYYLLKDGSCYQVLATGAQQSQTSAQTKNMTEKIFSTFKFTK